MSDIQSIEWDLKYCTLWQYTLTWADNILFIRGVQNRIFEMINKTDV